MESNPLEEKKRAFWAHVFPFGTWMACIMFLGDPTGGNYAVRTVLGLAALAWFRPWRWYGGMALRHVPVSLLLGVGVFVLWVVPETRFVQDKLPGLYRAYQLIGILPPWSVPDPVQETPFAPETCGWMLTLVRLGGSALVIPFIEEFFWRGFLYRWLINEDFLAQRLTLLRWGSLVLTALMFASVHHRWIAAFVTGIFYGLLVIRTGSIWPAVIAHAVTNLLLGVYVIREGAWMFW